MEERIEQETQAANGPSFYQELALLTIVETGFTIRSRPGIAGHAAEAKKVALVHRNLPPRRPQP